MASDAADTPALTQPPASVTLIVDPSQKKQLRNTFVFWEVSTFVLGLYVGKKIWEPATSTGSSPRRSRT